MFEPKDLSIAELKKFHKATRERIAAKDFVPTTFADRAVLASSPNYNPIKAEGRIVLSMLDTELDRRGYDPVKLFKGYEMQK